VQRLLPPQLFVVCAAAAAAIGWFVPVSAHLPAAVRLLGAPLLASGLMVAGRSAATFDRLDTNINTFDDPDVLVETAAFRYSRNPMYLGFTLALLGISTLVGSLTAFVGPVVFWLSADRWYVPFEERRMRAVFGPAYLEYCRGVPRWIGRPRSNRPRSPEVS
jgi:protein-S-isoprenylcysteine O-methyltransferase Ste14